MRLVVLIALVSVTVATGLAFFGKIRLVPGAPDEAGTVYYVVAYHYGYAFYDAGFIERERIEVREGDAVTLHIVPVQALPRALVLEYAERNATRAVGGLAPGDPRVGEKMLEDFALGNVEHIVGIASHPVWVTTNVTPLLGGKPFREGGPRTLREAVERGDPAITSITFRAKRVGAFDVLCMDSGMDGAGTCGWGHKWMVAKEAFVVRP